VSYADSGPSSTSGIDEVNRDRDPRMWREAAIKVAAQRFADRFEREFRAIAALNHGEVAGRRFEASFTFRLSTLAPIEWLLR
jgi:hypothetical protein